MNDDKKVFLQALTNLSKKKKKESSLKKLSAKDKSVNKTKGVLDKDKLKVKNLNNTKVVPDKVSVGKMDKISTRPETQKVTKPKVMYDKIDDFRTKKKLKESMKAAIASGDTATIKKLQKIGKSFAKGASKGLKMFPLIGGAVAALASGDASAMVPELVPGTSDLGPEQGSIARRLEMGEATDEDMKKLQDQLRRNAINNKK